MAQISIDYFSSSLMRTTTIDILLPFDSMDDALGTDWEMRSDEKGWDRRPYPPERPPFKTLYLLHGITGNPRTGSLKAVSAAGPPRATWR